ncbi:MAG TPA: nitrogen fixation protein NifH [Candidatus Lokiarchaeia archaeon]|nr:nitrogen fixation protein NifH [Candidatus Lokiarchaeia archaeon]
MTSRHPSWQGFLKSNPVEWLLEENNPSVRYFTLKDIQDRSMNPVDVQSAKSLIMITGVVPKILAKQEPGGYWGVPGDFYIRSKYKGTVWTFILLAQLGADGSDERIKRTCEFLLQYAQDRDSGGFACRGTTEEGGSHNIVIPCLTGNLAWSCLRFGYLTDPRVQKGIDWIVDYQRFDDGIEQAPAGWPYEKHHDCWGTHSCHMGVVKALKTLAEIPPEARAESVRKKIEAGAEYLLQHHIYKQSHALDKISKPEWLQLGFPWMWQTDILEILDILTSLGYRNERMQDAIDQILSKQDDEGRWWMERTLNGRFQASIEPKGKPSKWVTLHALKVVKRFYQ